MCDCDLLDINLWIALSIPTHVHHRSAEIYWNSLRAPEIAFCSVTMLGMLRLLSNPRIVVGSPLTPEEAWSIYSGFAQLPEARFLHDNPAVLALLRLFHQATPISQHKWTDAWIAAHAHCAGARVVSFDSDFTAFPGLRFRHLT